MDPTDAYISALEQNRKVSNELIEMYKKQIDTLNGLVDMYRTRSVLLEEVLCRVLEGNFSEEMAEKLLKKLRG